MRAETVHVTDHALLRWRERASQTGEAKVQDIVQAVKDSKVIKKSEPLPYPLPRVDGSVYSFNVKEQLLFILESVTIDEYRLVTVITGGPTYRGMARPPKKKPTNKKVKHVEQEKTEIDFPQFDSAIEERNWLTEEKRRLERELATTTKKSAKRKELLKTWGEIESRLTSNKSKFVQEQDKKYEEKKKATCGCEGLVLQLIHEVRELRKLVEALQHGQHGPQGNRSTTGPVHVQPVVSGTTDLAAQGNGPLQPAPEQDEAA
jgi:hypothetical protein